jgi:hypothetical protein
MRKLEIDASLSLKIIQNECRLKELFNNTKNRNRNNSEDFKYYYTENISENNSPNRNDNAKKYNENKNKKNIFEISSQKTMEIDRRNSKNKIKVNKNEFSKTLFMTRDNKKNKNSKNELKINPFINKTKNNPINSYNENISIRSPLNRNITSIRNIKFEKMITRFRASEEKKQKWISKEQTKKELKLMRHYQESPKLNQRSKKLNPKIKDNFLIRLQKSEYEKQQKAEILKEFMKKVKLEEEKKCNGIKGKSRTQKINFIVDKKLYETLDKFYLLKKKRKEQIKLIQKIQFEKTNKFDFVPKINKRSTSMAELRRKNYSTKNIFERLAKISKNSTEKKKTKNK